MIFVAFSISCDSTLTQCTYRNPFSLSISTVMVPGGGVALLRCVDALAKMKLSGDEQIGVEIVKRALEEPIRTIANNAGLEGSVVVNKVKEMKTNEGYDADKDAYGDMFQAGIIDPKKVTRSALQNAASIAALMITTETIVTDIPDEDKAPAGMPGGMPPGGMGGMY